MQKLLPARSWNDPGDISEKAGFTLVELLVVVAIIAVLAALLLPALGNTKAQAQGVSCLNNTKQLQLAWQLYTQDYNDHLVFVPTGGGPAAPIGWVDTEYGFANSGYLGGNINEMTVTLGLLWKYVGSGGVYRCPAQQGVCAGNFTFNPQISPGVIYTTPVRSFTICEGLNSGSPPDTTHPVLRLSDILYPRPSMSFVFADENLYSISDGGFTMLDYNNWLDVPGARHNGAGALSFADGHSEMHRWQEPSTISMNIAPEQVNTILTYPGPNGGFNRDYVWLILRYQGGDWFGEGFYEAPLR
jgi:prepilin-type N-terminal cleavage/methylation domain-containing protein/prepilin-type processing-associated H-X9-DG protein